nr:MAG TPA: hypothetical protein [Caudoviricetes sp.]
MPSQNLVLVTSKTRSSHVEVEALTSSAVSESFRSTGISTESDPPPPDDRLSAPVRSSKLYGHCPL